MSQNPRFCPIAEIFCTLSPVADSLYCKRLKASHFHSQICGIFGTPIAVIESRFRLLG